MALRDQGPLAKLTMWDNIVSPKGWGARIDYDQNGPWGNGKPAADPPSSFKYVFVHWGGGPNPAGQGLVEEPELTLSQKIANQLGRCSGVLRSWESYHLSKNWRGLAYNLLFDPRYGRIIRGRGWAEGAGCYGHWNGEGLSFNFILGLGQYPTRAARRTFGRVMLELGNVKAIPHYGTNFDTPPAYRTSCPGIQIGKWVENMGWCDDLPMLSLHKRKVDKGPAVASLTKRLTDLGHLDGVTNQYTPDVAIGVRKFQTAAGIQVDGICGPQTYRALQKMP